MDRVSSIGAQLMSPLYPAQADLNTGNLTMTFVPDFWDFVSF